MILHYFCWDFITNPNLAIEITPVKGKEDLYKITDDAVKEITECPDLLDEKHLNTSWGHLNPFDESDFLEELEVRLEEMLSEGRLSSEHLQELERRVDSISSNDLLAKYNEGKIADGYSS